MLLLGDDNQKLLVTAALLQVADWQSAEYLLGVLAPVLPASYPPVSAGLCKLLHQVNETFNPSTRTKVQILTLSRLVYLLC